MPKKILNTLSLFYLLILSAPLLWHIFTPESENLEKRNLAALPQWPDSWKAVESSKSELEAHLEDHFGLRTVLIQWTNEFKYYIFGEVTSPQITVGNNGFIYFNSHNKVAPDSMTKEVCGMVDPSDDYKIRSQQGIEKFIDYYQQQGIQVLFAVIPTKARVYPEYLPTQHKYWCSNNQLNWIDHLVKKVNRKNIIYPMQQFKHWKNSFQVYLSKYFHWNGELTAKTAEMIMENWGIELSSKVDSEEQQVKSDLSNHLPGMLFYDSSVKYTFENLKLCNDKNCIKGFTNKYQNGSVMLGEMDSNNGRNLLILGDSFTPYITPNFSRGFDQSISVNLNHLQKTEEDEFFRWIVDYAQPTHMLYLVHDGGLLWQALRLERIMGSLE